MEFFEGVSGSNFATQSANSLSRVESISDYKVILNPDKISSLSSTDKLKVIEAWKNHSKNILEDAGIRRKFGEFWEMDLSEIPNSTTLEKLLKTKDDWFNEIFKLNIE